MHKILDKNFIVDKSTNIGFPMSLKYDKERIKAICLNSIIPYRFHSFLLLNHPQQPPYYFHFQKYLKFY